MKRFLAILLALLCAVSFAQAEGENPYEEITLDTDVQAGDVIEYKGLDFGAGASLLRFKAAANPRLIISVYADTLDSEPIATAVFAAITKECRRNVSLSGVHDLYFAFEGGGSFHSWQAFTDEADIEAAIKAERAGVYEDRVPAKFTSPCAQGGTVEKFTYQAHDYINGGDTYEKTAFVYLPYGYTADNTYDLLILCHGIGGSEYEWGLANSDSRVKRIMDNLIDQDLIKPFIVVTPNGRAGKTQDHSSFYCFDEELRSDLLPALAEKYALDITDRNRCAMAGLSMGGMQTINLGLGKCLDLFSAFGAFSACPTTNTASVTAKRLTEKYPIRYLYSICGTEDNIAYASAFAAVDGLDGMTKMLNKDNFQVQYIPGGHDFGVWYLGFYNFARMIGEK